MTRTLTTLLGATVLAATLVSPAAAQIQNVDQQRCITGMNRAAGKLTKTFHKLIRECVRAAEGGGLGALADISSCVAADSKGKVAGAQAKVLKAETRCTEAPPNFGFTAGADVNAAAIALENALGGDLYGDDYDQQATQVGGGKCRSTLTKDYGKLADSIMKAFVSCKKDGLGDASIDSVADLEACLLSLTSTSDKKVTKAAQKIQLDALSRCEMEHVPTLLPGQCADESTGVIQFGECVERLTRCRTCIIINAADSMNADCDFFDDGEVNLTCPPPPLVTTTTTTTSTTTTTTSTTTSTTTTLPDCAQVAAPTCNGACPAGEGCLDQGGSCACVVTTTTTTTTTTVTTTTTTTTTTTLPCDLEEHVFTSACVDLTLTTSVTGTQQLQAFGSVTFLVDMCTLGDANSNNLEEVETQITFLEFVASDPSFGTITVRLQDNTVLHPIQGRITTGTIEEDVNNTPGKLDLPPHAVAGSAFSQLGVWIQAEISGQINTRLHHDVEMNLEASISADPPASGELHVLQNVPIPIVNDFDQPFFDATIDAMSIDLDAATCP